MSRIDYEYGGKWTSLNGLTKWLATNFELTGNTNQRAEQCYSAIIKYAEANIPDFKKKGHASSAANHIALKIHKNKKFKHFTEWCLNNLK